MIKDPFASSILPKLHSWTDRGSSNVVYELGDLEFESQPRIFHCV
jgi:hypothetical protein